LTPAQLSAAGTTRSALVANLAARRWQRCGKAIVLHAGPLTRNQRWRVALINCGPHSVLTAFTAAEFAGLRSWTRDEIHVLTPAGTDRPASTALPIRMHRTARLPIQIRRPYRCQLLAPALLLAAAEFRSPRPACAILAAAVQQRLLASNELLAALTTATRIRHRSLLLAAMNDIAGGAQALSEIDFVQLCRRNRLPAPIQQLVRQGPSGQRRYLDATWRRCDGRLVVVEVDGALHLSPIRWWDDQLRQNELALADALVLRFPSVVVRTEEATVVRQLRRALHLTPDGF
jgi:very-short-patch-repair endonuclease